MLLDGSCTRKSSGAGVVLVSPNRELLQYMFYLTFKTSNNAAEYEALLAGLRTALSLGVRQLRVKGDSQLVINQVTGKCACVKAHLAAYLAKVKKMELSFEAIEFNYIPREENTLADELSTLASARVPPPDGVFHNRVLRPSAEPVQTDPGGDGQEMVVASGVGVGPSPNPGDVSVGPSNPGPHSGFELSNPGEAQAPGSDHPPETEEARDGWIQEIRALLEDNILPDDDATVERVIRQAKRYVVVEGYL